MEEVYKEILKRAISFYKKGREGDIEHVKWLFKIIPKYIRSKDVDFDILIPLVILHDVGYSKVPKGANPFNLEIRKFHSEEGAKIAERILKDLKYQKEKRNEIKRLILKHDNWAFGDSFSNEPFLRIFNNFDFMWMASEKGFEIVRKFTKKTPKEFYKKIELFQKENLKCGRKWYNDRIEKLYDEMMKSRKNELSKSLA